MDPGITEYIAQYYRIFFSTHLKSIYGFNCVRPAHEESLPAPKISLHRPEKKLAKSGFSGCEFFPGNTHSVLQLFAAALQLLSQVVDGHDCVCRKGTEEGYVF